MFNRTFLYLFFCLVYFGESMHSTIPPFALWRCHVILLTRDCTRLHLSLPGFSVHVLSSQIVQMHNQIKQSRYGKNSLFSVPAKRVGCRKNGGILRGCMSIDSTTVSKMSVRIPVRDAVELWHRRRVVRTRCMGPCRALCSHRMDMWARAAACHLIRFHRHPAPMM
jgi:hypothetical protein